MQKWRGTHIFDQIRLGDSKYAYFGDSKDISITWDGTNLEILPLTDDTGSINIGNGTLDIDVKIFLSTTAKYVLFDVGNVLLQLEDVDLKLGDNDILQFGDAAGGDVSVKWNASALVILPAAADTGSINVGDGTTDIDVKIFLGSANEYVLFDVGNSRLDVGKDATGLDAKFYGVTSGAYMEWDSSADRLNIVTVSGRAISGEEHAVDIVNGGTVSSGDSMVGLNVKTTVSGSAASWVSGLFVNATQASKAVNGYICAAEFELTSTAANASDNAVVVLNSVRNHTGSPPACDPYILLREYGTTYANVFLRVFGDTGQGAITGGADTTLLCTGTADKAANCAVRCMFGSSVFWLLGTTTAPS